MPSRKLTVSIAAGIAAIAVAGGSYGIVSATSGSSSAAASSASAGGPGPGGPGFGGRSANARSGPAAGGSAGTVSSMSGLGFTLSTAAGQKVTVDETSATTYQKGTSPASRNAVTAGGPVLVLGTTSGTAITATQVIVQPAGSASAASTAATVIPFKRGAPATSEQTGQIPADYTEGSGTIVSGAAADKATEAALAAYPGGVVDRVVKLSSGEYEVHNIGINWPHHVFVSQDFKVLGAE